MSTGSKPHTKKMDLDEVLSFVQAHEEPCVASNDIAEHFDVSQKAARYRLGQLVERGDIQRKDVGARGAVWYSLG